MIIRSNSSNILLSSITVEDADMIAKSANAPDISYNLGGKHNFPFPYTRKDALLLIDTASMGYATKTSYHLAIKNSSNRDIIGMLALHDIDMDNKHCELGYWIGSGYRNRGYATSAIKLGLSMGFGILSLNKISSKVLEFNSISIHILEKLGFEKEGTLVDNNYINDETNKGGSFVNQHIYAIFRKNYPDTDIIIE